MGTFVPMVAVAQEVELDADPDHGAAEPVAPAAPRWVGWAVGLVAVGVPLALFVHAALGTVITFDGAMNLQVAQNLATGDGWIRQYGPPTPFPSEVQTSGAFLVVAAGAILALGSTQLAFQAANLVFIALFLVAIVHLLRGHRVAQLVVPTLVIVGLPETAFLSIGGLGEVPVFACILATFVLLSRVAAGETTRPHIELFAAVAFTVTAVTIKTVAVAALPIVVVGLVAAAVVNRRVRPVPALGAVVAGLLPIVVIEGHRLLALGGLGPYRDYWDGLREDIDYQAGVAEGTQLPLTEKIPEHLRLLAANTGHPKWLLVGLFVVPILLSLVLLVRHRRRLRVVIEDRLRFCAVLLTGYAGLYAVWWFAFTPTDKAWLRRLYPGLLAAQLATMLFLVIAVGAARRRGVEPARRSMALAGAAVLAVLTVAGPVRMAVDEGQLLLDPPVAQLRSFEEAAATIAADDTHQYWGEHWLSAPAVSLMAETDFGDLSLMDMCTIDPARDILVWDYVANSAVGPPAERDTRELTLVREFPSAATFYAVGPAEGLCPRE
jgi:hypothetical protein